MRKFFYVLFLLTFSELIAMEKEKQEVPPILNSPTYLEATKIFEEGEELKKIGEEKYKKAKKKLRKMIKRVKKKLRKMIKKVKKNNKKRNINIQYFFNAINLKIEKKNLPSDIFKKKL